LPFDVVVVIARARFVSIFIAVGLLYYMYVCMYISYMYACICCTFVVAVTTITYCKNKRHVILAVIVVVVVALSHPFVV